MLCAGFAALVGAGAADAAGDVTCSYSDPDFGIHTHALDIDKVRVERSEAELLTFALEFPETLDISRDTGFQIAFDTDADDSTGDPDGFERFFAYVEGDPAPNPWLSEWRAGDWQIVDAPSLAFSHRDSGVTFTVGTPDLAVANAFSFRVAAGTHWSSDSADVDVAPEREHVVAASDPGVWTFPACGMIDDDPVTGGGSFPLGIAALVLFGAGAVVGITGFVVERVRGRRRPA